MGLLMALEQWMMVKRMVQAAAVVLLLASVVGEVRAMTEGAMLASNGPSLVAVTATENEKRHSASGVVIRPREVITSCSLVVGRSGLEVAVDGSRLPATLLVADQEKDLCLLAVAGLAAPPVVRGNSTDLAMQMSVWAVGMRGDVPTVEPGVVTQLRGGKPPLIETTVLGTPETVGRGLFDRQGRCIGITTLFRDGAREAYFAAPVEWLDSLRIADGSGGADKPIHWLKRAVILEEADDWETLREWSRQWSATLPGEAAAWHTLGYSCIVLKDPAGALAAFERTVQINPGDLDGWSNLGYVYTDLNQYLEAIRAYRQVVRINPGDVEGWSNLAVAYQAIGDREAALEAIRELQRLDREKAADLMLYLNGQ
jgi:hypothetical protein